MSRPTSVASETIRRYVGKCIYCQSTENLQDEHCLAHSLGGFHLLEKASCDKCGKITGKFEGDYTRRSLLPARTALDMRSKRSKNKRPTEFPMWIKRDDGERELVNVPVKDHVSLIPLVEMGPPGVIPEWGHKDGLKSGEFKVHPFSVRSGEQIRDLRKKYKTDELSVDIEIDVSGFCRMIAKIAYCHSVWKFGLGNIQEAFVLPAILGTKEDIFQWVGSDGRQFIHEEMSSIKADHTCLLRYDKTGKIVARVKLFTKSLTPEYDVIIGRLTDRCHALLSHLGAA